MPNETIRDVIGRALEAYGALAELGEDVEDEWSYVNDLCEAWQARFDETVAARADESATADLAAAVDRVIDEIGRIEDPHRAIDWLSTFPQVVLLAAGEAP